jgi:hypothetical protein
MLPAVSPSDNFATPCLSDDRLSGQKSANFFSVSYALAAFIGPSRVPECMSDAR